MNNSTVTVVVIAAIGVGFVAGSWVAMHEPPSPEMAAMTENSSVERKVLFYRNPMNPAITSPVFTQDDMGMDYIAVYADEGKPKEKEVLFYRNPMNPAITSPVFTQDDMGMDYIPVYANGGGDDEPAGTVTIDPVTVQNIGVRTARVETHDLSRALNGLGRVDFNEERLFRLHPKTSGWIEQLRVDETGKRVNKDTILLGIYSPELVAAQQEYLVALNNWETVRNSSATQMKKSSKIMVESARERLQLFDVPEHQIHELEQSRKIKKQLHIHSPFEGRVMHIGVREGQYVTPKDELYLIADLGRIWVNVDIFEDELSWLKVGDRAEMRVRAEPGRTYNGKITFIHPTLNRKSRTVQVRLEFDNSDLSLKPGMFSNVTLYVDPQLDALVVPSEAIVRSGSREQLFVVREPGKFEPREVTLGVTAQGMTQILSGVEAGEEVVTSSQFLIDSESKLREATAKMMAVMAAESAVEEDMSDMSMDDMGMDDMDMGDMTMEESSHGH
ncbi:Probable Co/Zn/Cd efflux system membrane fusion protein [hydrothermal vent metagenome]|uniref:Probable Co/Zn/Cd efflux system membrane fusion protein n=1 Tax=hydrothermal vent metagenome TaxID=652676 RepID=A0A3B0ZQE5_9ZZZZ